MNSDTTVSVWQQTTDVDYMRREGRARHPSHRWVTKRLADLYRDAPFHLLDIGVMSGVTYEELHETSLSVAYTGIDIGQGIIEECRTKNPEATWHQMNVTDLAFGPDRFDVVNCRHVLECLPYYETAVREMFRVARQHVILCFGHAPRDPEFLLRRETPHGYIWLNRYAPGPLEHLLERLSTTVEQIDIRHEHRLHRIYVCTK